MIIEPLFLFFFSLVPLLWLRGNEVILGHDAGFRFNFVEHLKNLYFSWYPNANFGIDWSLYHGFIPIQFWETIFSYLTHSLSLGQRFTFVFWFFTIGLSMYIFVRYFFSEEKYQLLRITAPIFYMFNFYILNAWTIAERAKFSLYIALPLMIVIFFKTMEKEWSVVKGGIFFGILFFCMNGGGSPPLYGGILVTFGFMTLCFLVNNLKQLPRILTFTSVCIVCFLFLNAYWVLPQYRLIKDSYAGAVSNRGGIEGLISWEKEISKYASIPNILRLQGFPDWYNNPEHPYANVYLSNPILIVGSYIPLAVIVLGFLIFGFRASLTKQKQLLVFLIVLSVIGLFFTAGSHPPFGFLYMYLMRHIPGFAVFRSSFYKFAPTVYITVIVFFGYYVSQFLDRLKVKTRGLFVASVIVAIGIVFYHFPFLAGNFFGLKLGFSTRVTVPGYIERMVKTIQNQTKDTDRILLVPPLDVGYINSPIDTYTWGFYSLDVLPRIFVNRSFLANDTSDDSVTRLMYQSLREGNEKTFLSLAAHTGVTHILWRGDVRLTPDTEKKMPMSQWEKNIEHMSNVRIFSHDEYWKLYRLESQVMPMVSAVTDVTRISQGATDDGYLVGKLMSENAVIRTPITDADYIQAECFLCKTNEYTRLIEAVVIPPSEKYSFGVIRAWKEKNEQQILFSVKDKPNEIDVRLSLATKALSTLKDISKYKEHMMRIIEVLVTLTGRERDYYANRVMAYLEAHKKYSSESYIVEAQKKVGTFTWMADENVYRFGITVPKDDDYRLWIPVDGTYGSKIEIDGLSYALGSTISLKAGYHRFLMTPTNTANTFDTVFPVFLYRNRESNYGEAPQISFTQINPTRYNVSIMGAKNPFTLVFNQRFDPGWGIAIDGVQQKYVHQEANGFGNAWMVPKVGNYTITLYFIPQQFMYIGSIITGISLLAASWYLVCVGRKQ